MFCFFLWGLGCSSVFPAFSLIYDRHRRGMAVEMNRRTSAEFDLVIRGGLVVHGTGAPGALGDVAIIGNRIAVVGKVDGQGREEIDAEGHVVAPGFIDSHSHMDAQVFWDDLGKAICWHGVTTTVMGNCGFTLAPARKDRATCAVVNIEVRRGHRCCGDGGRASTGRGRPLPSAWAQSSSVPGAQLRGPDRTLALRTWAMGECVRQGRYTKRHGGDGP